MTRTSIITTKKFKTCLPASFLDAPLCDIARWAKKGLVRYTKHGWVEIRSKQLWQDVRDEPGLIEFIANNWNQCHDVTRLNLHDGFRMQKRKAELREQGRHREIKEMEKSGEFATDKKLERWIEKCCKALDELEAEMRALNEIEQAHKTATQIDQQKLAAA